MNQTWKQDLSNMQQGYNPSDVRNNIIVDIYHVSVLHL
jgi:hypothetical protein